MFPRRLVDHAMRKAGMTDHYDEESFRGNYPPKEPTGDRTWIDLRDFPEPSAEELADMAADEMLGCKSC